MLARLFLLAFGLTQAAADFNWLHEHDSHSPPWSQTSHDSNPVIQGDCVAGDKGLSWLSKQLSNGSVIACRGTPLQLNNAGRYWGEQYGKNASVVVYPSRPEDVSYAVQATEKTSLGLDFAFVGGAHGQTNASSSYSYVIDLSYLNQTQIIHNYTVNGSKDVLTVVAYQGGTTAYQVASTLSGSGYIAVTPRIGNVGMGGFSTGGGIGFLAGPYGFAVDRLVAVDVVLPVTGKMVTATAFNQYSDLFWALRGGGGQFGIVTNFYQKAAPEPTVVTVSVYYIDSKSVDESQQNVADFFKKNNDPFAVVYYGYGFYPDNLLDPNPAPSSFALRTILITLWFGNPLDPQQKSANATFGNLLTNLSFDISSSYNFDYVQLYLLADSLFPYGFRRGFWGPQAVNVSSQYLKSAEVALSAHVNTLVQRGEFPATALWLIQYMSPGLNGNLPKSNADTAWPHAVAGHQTLFSPAWSLAGDDGLAVQANNVLNLLTYAQEALVGPTLADYPNYISPGASGSRVWGDNVERLIDVKQKYDPECTIHNGRVFASSGCVKGGWGNIFA